MKIGTIYKIQIALLLLFILAISEIPASAEAGEKKLSIICSLFPQYDFARQITGELADVKLLLKPGTEPHEFEPSPRDIKILNDADAFIYTGDYMEPWAIQILRSLTKIPLVINASNGIELVNDAKNKFDPHVWLDLQMAQKIIFNISSQLCELDSEHAEIYKENASSYASKLAELDSELMDISLKSKGRMLVFAGPFSFGYFMKRYGLNYISAYDGENEPGMRQIAQVIKYVRDNEIKYILCDAFEVTQISHSIAQQTGAQVLTFNSVHEISAKDLSDDLTFLDVMQENRDVLTLALANE